MKKNLISTIKTEFHKRFNGNPILIASPGRINLIGEHTDYNKGLVFPAAIDKYIIGAFAKNNQQKSRIYSLDFNESYDIDLSNIEKQEIGSWKNYVAGVIDGLLKSGVNVANFDLVFGGNIPIGAGLSSSAALENCCVFGMNELFNLNISKAEMIHISLQAEHKFAGVECGIMDQFSSMMGKSNQAILLNCEDLSFEYIPIKLKDYEIILINSKVKHALADSAYNQRRNECNEGLKTLQKMFPKLKSLAQTKVKQLLSVKDELSPTVYNRCLYVIEENERVLKTKKAIENEQWEEVGELLFKSHHGLQYLYEVSCEELDFLVEQSKVTDAIIGSRMMGGGFGGCTLNLIKINKINTFKKMITKKYFSTYNLTLEFYKVNLSKGTHIIDSKLYNLIK